MEASFVKDVHSSGIWSCSKGTERVGRPSEIRGGLHAADFIQEPGGSWRGLSGSERAPPMWSVMLVSVQLSTPAGMNGQKGLRTLSGDMPPARITGMRACRQRAEAIAHSQHFPVIPTNPSTAGVWMPPLPDHPTMSVRHEKVARIIEEGCNTNGRRSRPFGIRQVRLWNGDGSD